MALVSPADKLDQASAEAGLSLRSDPELTKKVRSSTSLNKLAVEDRAFHDWYRFVLSFPPHLVREYLIDKFKLPKGSVVLDPFCGTGTTIAEAQLNSLSGVGIEANDIAFLAGSTKITWNVNTDDLLHQAERVSKIYEQKISAEKSLRTLSEVQEKLTLANSISPLPLHKSLILIEACQSIDCEEKIRKIFLVALAKTLVFTASNLHFGPEVGVRGRKEDAPVFEAWFNQIKTMAQDLSTVSGKDHTTSEVFHGDSRSLSTFLKPASIDAVFTSPPYPNEKDYTRTTRLESVLLGYIKDKQDLRKVKKTLLRSNTRGVYKEDSDDQWITNNKNVNAIADEIERRRIELGKQSGFEKLYARVTRLYFGGMARHLAELRPFLKPGAMLGYVVGDQASYLQVMIRTGNLLAEIADELGYEVVSIDLFRTRISTVTKAYMREEVLVLKWRG